MDQVVAHSGAGAFRALILLSRKTATGIRVPEEVVEQLDGGKRPRVHVTLNGCSYRSTVAPMGGGFMLPVSADVREADSNKQRFDLSIEGAKTDETRQRRIAMVVATLREERT